MANGRPYICESNALFMPENNCTDCDKAVLEKIDELKEEIKNTENNLESVKAELQNCCLDVQENIKDIQSDVNNLDTKIDDVKDDLDTTNASVDQLRQDVSDTKSELGEVKAQSDETAGDLNNLIDKVNAHINEATSLRVGVDDEDLSFYYGTTQKNAYVEQEKLVFPLASNVPKVSGASVSDENITFYYDATTTLSMTEMDENLTFLN